MATLSDLPNETLLHVARHLPAASRARLAQVGRRFNQVADDPCAWERIYLRDAGRDAYDVAKAQDSRGWKARYADIHQAVCKPFLTPPALAQVGERVTVKALRQNGDEDTVCEVVRPMHLGTLKVRPLGPKFGANTPALMVLPWHCIDGSVPKLVPAPVESFKDYEAMKPGSMGLVLDSLPLKTLLTTGIRPGIRVKIQRLAVGLSGAVYFMVEEPKGSRTLQELVSIHAAEERAKAVPAGLVEGLMHKAKSLFAPHALWLE